MQSPCFEAGKKLQQVEENAMTGVVKTDYSPKKGKENKNISNNIPVPTTIVRKNAKNETKTQLTPKRERAVDSNKIPTEKSLSLKSPDKKKENVSKDAIHEEENCSSSTSDRSVRPQTKILRRPTPNLKHPVIQVDSDGDSGGDSSSSDKSKEENPKRLKMGCENLDASHKRKNFIMYNKYNVDKNIKNGSKERTASSPQTSVPNPCNSCNRSQAPERLHSHARKDARGLMHRRSPASDVKMASPQKKKDSDFTAQGKTKDKEIKRSRSVERTKDVSVKDAESLTPEIETESKSLSDISTVNVEPQTSIKDFLELTKACYICQKEFKVSLLLLHESKCLETWKKTNNSLTPHLRQLPPRRPDAVLPPSAEGHAPDPGWSTIQSQLVPCELCGRTFFPERLPVHQKVCKGKQSPRPLKRTSSLREQSASSTDGEETKQIPLYLPCYICNRNYGSWVLPMHEQQCLIKWRKENEKLSHEDRQQEPRTSAFNIDDDVTSLVELGDNAWESHLKQLVPCPCCARTFFPDRLEIHQRSCKGPSNNRRPGSNKGV